MKIETGSRDYCVDDGMTVAFWVIKVCLKVQPEFYLILL